MSAIPIPEAEIETLESMRARFAEAIKTPMDVRKIAKNTEELAQGKLPPPGLIKQHRFDFPNGARMIASQDTEGTETLVHLSFGVMPGTTLGSLVELKLFALNTSPEFIGSRQPIESFFGMRAFHLFYRPE